MPAYRQKRSLFKSQSVVVLLYYIEAVFPEVFQKIKLYHDPFQGVTRPLVSY